MDEELEIDNHKLLRFLLNDLFVWDETRKEYWAQIFDKDTKSTMVFTLKENGEFIYAFINDINNTKGNGKFVIDMPNLDTIKEWDW